LELGRPSYKYKSKEDDGYIEDQMSHEQDGVAARGIGDEPGQCRDNWVANPISDLHHHN